MAKTQHQSRKGPQRQQRGIAYYPTKVGRLFIRAYQYFISPMLGSNCRFSPRCSDYALGAFEHFGVARGIWLTLKRIAKCHPWHEGGEDPLPEINNTGLSTASKSLHKRQ